LIEQDACESQGGDWQPFAVCGDDPCASEFRACCFEDGSCEDLIDQDSCEAAGGNWHAIDTCDVISCPQPGIRVCCFGNGGCELTTEGDCNAQGGSWLAGVTTCAIDPCGASFPECPGPGSCFDPFHQTPGCEDEACCNLVCDISPSCCVQWNEGCAIFATSLCDAPPSGACCVPETGCVETTQSSCESSGGVWQGPDTVCAGDTCPDLGPIGACCVNESCFQLTEAGCSLLFGQWQGAGTDCFDVSCGPQGACCIGVDTCEVQTQSDCETAGGVYKGDSTECSVDICDDTQPSGACCLPATGACFELTESGCTLSGGTWQGAGSTCVAVDCPRQGACCLDIETCQDMTDQECEAAGGSFIAGTACYAGICSPEVAEGACCIEGSCVSLYEFPCALLGGVWLGGGTSCAVVTCGADVCEGDTNRDGVVDTTDFNNVIDCWGSDGIDCPSSLVFADVDVDGVVGIIDLLEVLRFWGPCPADAEYSTDWRNGTDGWVGSGDQSTAFTLIDGTWFAPNTPSDFGFSADLLTSPIFVVEDAGSVAFGFTHYYEMESGFDGGIVRLSVNGGFSQPFDMPDYDGPVQAIGGVPDGYTGKNLTPHLSGTTIDSVINGDTIQFIFQQGDDGTIGLDGWYIDDFHLVGASIP
jgi:hypothetical protein